MTSLPGSTPVTVSPAGGETTGEGVHPGRVLAPHVVGIDLSLTATGIACRHGAEVIETEGHRDDTLVQRHIRLRDIRRAVLAWCGDADLVVIEAPSFGSRGGSAHDRAGLWWSVVAALLARDVRVVEVSPKTRAKYATGDGNADKFEVLAAAIRRLGYDGHDHNAVDALWLSAIGHALLGEPLVDLPAKHREALAAVRFDVSEVTV